MASLADLGSGSFGLWTRSQALAVTSRHTVQRLLAHGIWQVVLPTVYADGGYQLDDAQRSAAAVLRVAGSLRAGGATGVLCGRSAARLWGMVLIDDADPATGAAQHLLIDVTSAGGRPTAYGDDHRSDGDRHLVVRHRLRCGEQEVLTRPDGLRVTTPVRTVVDCAALLGRDALVCLLDDALRRRLLSRRQLQEAVVRRAGLPGTDGLRRAVALADGRAEAPSETLARLLLLPHLPALVPQVLLLDRRGQPVARFDLADERARLAVELDGRRGHAGERMVARDQRRDRATVALGWVTERATWYDVRRRQDELVARIVTRHRSR